MFMNTNCLQSRSFVRVCVCVFVPSLLNNLIVTQKITCPETGSAQEDSTKHL